MDNESYFAEVQNLVGEIMVEVSKQSLQPREGPVREPRNPTKWTKDSGAVYTTSIKNREVKEHKEGLVQLVPYWLAAKGIMAGLHRVSTDDEIKKFVAEQKAKREEILGAAARNRGVAQFNVVPPVLEVK